MFLLSVEELWSKNRNPMLLTVTRKCSFITNPAHILGLSIGLLGPSLRRRLCLTQNFSRHPRVLTLFFIYFVLVFVTELGPFFPPLRHFGTEITKAVQASLSLSLLSACSFFELWNWNQSLSFCWSCNKLICPSLCAPVFFHPCE